MRLQIARLAAQHAAQVALLPSAPASIPVVVTVSCPRTRAVIREGLAAITGVEVIDAANSTSLPGVSLSRPSLRLVDRLGDLADGGVVSAAELARTVLVIDRVPRSDALPSELAGVLALPLNPNRVSRYICDLLTRRDQWEKS